jgi:hypothetical protein
MLTHTRPELPLTFLVRRALCRQITSQHSELAWLEKETAQVTSRRALADILQAYAGDCELASFTVARANLRNAVAEEVAQ